MRALRNSLVLSNARRVLSGTGKTRLRLLYLLNLYCMAASSK